ncbi:hypothetical protein TorRG33x02_344040, partial [Trema orientale]
MGAAVARDTQCRALATRIAIYQCSDPLVAEATALLLGVQLAHDQSWSNIAVESDCL